MPFESRSIRYARKCFYLIAVLIYFFFSIQDAFWSCSKVPKCFRNFCNCYCSCLCMLWINKPMHWVQRLYFMLSLFRVCWIFICGLIVLFFLSMPWTLENTYAKKLKCLHMYVYRHKAMPQYSFKNHEHVVLAWECKGS